MLSNNFLFNVTDPTTRGKRDDSDIITKVVYNALYYSIQYM